MNVHSLRWRPGRLLCASALLAALTLLGGCGKTAVVSGTVLYKKQPLTTGEVSFIAADGKSRSGLIGRDGRYEIRDAPQGSVTIVVVAKQVAGNRVQGSPTGFVRPPAAANAKAQPSAITDLIPPKFNDPKTSGLTYVVGRGKQTKDIDLGD